MEQGLANKYGSGKGNTITHHYGGTISRPKKLNKNKKDKLKK